MKRGCGTCGDINSIQKFGYYFRKDDSRKIQRYRCKSCGACTSSATGKSTFRQKKRRITNTLGALLASGVSMRRSAKLLKVSYSTVVKRTRYLAEHCRKELGKQYAEMTNIRFIQFDELQTIEHTKCKPLANAVAVNSETREILGFEVSSMPATGHLSKISSGYF